MPPNWQREAKSALAFPPAIITGRQALEISRGFAKAIGEGPYKVYACATLPDHVHLVIGASERRIRQVVGHLRSRATHALREQDLWDGRPLSGEHGWNVYLESAAAVERAIRYVNNNPLKEGKKRQTWSFVVPFVAAEAIRLSAAAQADRAAKPPRRIGGAALKSQQERGASDAAKTERIRVRRARLRRVQGPEETGNKLDVLDLRLGPAKPRRV